MQSYRFRTHSIIWRAVKFELNHIKIVSIVLFILTQLVLLHTSQKLIKSSSKWLRYSTSFQLNNNNNKRTTYQYKSSSLNSEEYSNIFINMSSTDYSFTESEIIGVRESLITWYIKNRRMLPWRGDATGDVGQSTPEVSPYGIWVSEIMAQQTRIETVLPYWYKWMQRYPTVQSLALADEDEVNGLWAGLGYYRRCRLLLAGAKEVVNKYNSIVPSSVDLLVKIPGIGPYTGIYSYSHIAIYHNIYPYITNIMLILTYILVI